MQARGIAIGVVDVPGIATSDTLTALGIADDITRLNPADTEAFVRSGAAAAIFVIAESSDGDAHADLVARTIGASNTSTRICHVAGIELLRAHRGTAETARSVAALRADHGRHAVNIMLQHHDSRFGTSDSMPARVVAAAYRRSRGETTPRLELVEAGPTDWGWTPEYVDAVQRIAALDRPRDLVVASGHSLTTAEFARHAFEFFGLDAEDHVRIEAGADPAPAIDSVAIATALKVATGWSASTWGRDLVRALCEGAGDRAPPPQGPTR